MNNLLISESGFATVSDVAAWVNQLPGRAVPGSSNTVVKQVLQFQAIVQGDSLSALVLVETERKKSMSSMVLNMRKDLGYSQDE
jgi:hypothetical protein